MALQRAEYLPGLCEKGNCLLEHTIVRLNGIWAQGKSNMV